MPIFTLADPHLSFGCDKPMDIFQGWADAPARLEAAWRGAVGESDTVVLPGDISWGMDLTQALPDFQFLHSLPGTKILAKGNHDYWFSTRGKVEDFWAAHGLHSLRLLHNNAFLVEGAALCGSRGWFFDCEAAEDQKVLARECTRLRLSIREAKKQSGQVIVFLHYPPIANGRRCEPLCEILREEGIRRCYYGHLHGTAQRWAFQGEWEGCRFTLVAADFLRFAPHLVDTKSIPPLRQAGQRGELPMNRYASAKEEFAALGVDTEAAIDALLALPVSIQCWQGDDVRGFESGDVLSGGIAATGNYRGRARSAEELMADLAQVLKLAPGKHKINLHAIYAVPPDGQAIPRDKLAPEHFAPWLAFAQEHRVGVDVNPTLFSHPLAADGMTLSHPDPRVRRFWIDHCKAMRRVGAWFARALGQCCVNNIWIPDGLKDTPADRYGPRARLKEALDEILEEKHDPAVLIDTVESKVFGIGLESYTVGSHEFYLQYAAKNGCVCLLDNGHYHPTEAVSDKISALLLFHERLALHLTRGVRWDSDHVPALDDELRAIANEIVRCGALERVLLALDYFDASINRVAAWLIGLRNVRKALLTALLLPHKEMKKLQDRRAFTRLLALQEEYKLLPVGDVWAELCVRAGVPAGTEWIDAVERYEKNLRR
jgi:L-rhamnose isomerase